MYMGLPMVLLIMLALILIYAFVTNRTVPGRQIYAVGGNRKAAALSGIKADRVMFWIYTNMGLLAALAGIVCRPATLRLRRKRAICLKMDTAIAACYIGGTAVAGGSGTVTGAVVGAFIMGVLNNGMSLLGWSVDVQRVVKGMVLLVAVAADLYFKKKNQYKTVFRKGLAYGTQ